MAQRNSDTNVPAFVSAAAMVGRGRGRPAGSGSKTMITKQNALAVLTEAQKAATLRLEDEAPQYCVLGKEPSSTTAWAKTRIDRLTGQVTKLGPFCLNCYIQKEPALPYPW